MTPRPPIFSFGPSDLSSDLVCHQGTGCEGVGEIENSELVVEATFAKVGAAAQATLATRTLPSGL